MNEKEFYEGCSYLLGVHHEYVDPTPVPKMPDREGNIRNTYKGRYNGRTPGNGRFPGCGIIRNFGTMIQVRLTNPVLHGNFANFDEALQAIGKAVGGPVRLLTEAEREEAKRFNREASEKIKAMIKERGGIPFHEKLKSRLDPFSDGLPRWSCGHHTWEHTHDEARECAKNQIREAEENGKS